MSGSLATWLALREPADAAARSTSLADAVAGRLQHARPLRVLDLGTGTGSNIRFLSQRLPAPQQWLAVDEDATLLMQLVSRTQVTGQIEIRCANLGPAPPADIFERRHLVTASALLDLVSDSWIKLIAERCRAENALALFALNYDGRSHCLPAEPEDDDVRELMNRHQRTNDKGFGRAAGPDAIESAARWFAAVGYQVRRDVSNWALSPDMRELQRQLIEGWADAAVEIAPERRDMIGDWRARRLSHVDANRSHIVVGHEDVAAWAR
jgi:SAM-dependent methyltransferase